METNAAHWERVEALPEFQELRARRRRFVVPATAFFLAWYIGFILLSGYAESFMGESVHEGLTVGYVLALSQFIMVWGLSWAYLRYAERVLDPLRERALARATELGAPGDTTGTGRVEPAAAAPTKEVPR